MPSIIEGYNYDIFISYRQKDNKHDGWVTEFVNNLKGELESTFKEEISVYFDINPHDGLLETHDVDASLKDKLKCLVFVPIISRTYCDPKSFAWEHEFKAFVEQASQDQYGLKVKLSGGNVANRVLPVLIHELDPEDKKLVENELGGYIRGIEFIYKEPGINKPLRPDDDEKKNLNKTKYGYQVNKVANAIREIMNGIKSPDHSGKEISEKYVEDIPSSAKKLRTRILAVIVILATLIVPGYFIIQGLIKPVVKIQKSIAVLPFMNYSDDPLQESVCASLTDAIINHLYKIKALDRVVPFQSVLQYKGSGEKPSGIASNLKVNYLVQGNYKKYGDKVRVTVYLLDPKKDSYIWTHDYDTIYSAADVITIQSDIALKIAGQLQANLSDEENKNITRIGTRNNEAFESLQKAKSINFMSSDEDYVGLVDSCIKYSIRAIDLDPDYAEAYAYTGAFWSLKAGYFGEGGHDMKEVMPEAKRYAEKALKLDPSSGMAHLILGGASFYVDYKFVEAEEHYQKGYDLEPNNFYVLYSFIELQMKMGRYRDVLSLINLGLSKGIQVEENKVFLAYLRNNDTNMARQSVYKFQLNLEDNNLWIGERYLWLNYYDSVIYYLNKGRSEEKGLWSLPKFQSYLGIAYYKTNKFHESQVIMNQLKEKSKYTSVGSPDFFVGGYYSMINQKDSAFAWLGKAFTTRSPEITWLKADPMFDNLKDDPRYLHLYEKVGFKAYDDYRTGLKKTK